jgi:hypothetical protein
MTAEPVHTCPIPFAHDKLNEAHWFLHATLREIHDPETFRWNLNAFLQALKSVDDLLGVELKKSPTGVWYKERRSGLAKEPFWKAVVNSRNIVVHRGLLETSSKVYGGLFRGRRLKLAIPFDLPIEIPSHQLLHRIQAASATNSVFVDADRSAIGEQLGIQRKWFVPTLDSEVEVPTVAHRAWASIHEVVRQVHDRLGSVVDAVPLEPEGAHDFTSATVLLESDTDPSLPDQRGWLGTDDDDD